MDEVCIHIYQGRKVREEWFLPIVIVNLTGRVKVHQINVTGLKGTCVNSVTTYTFFFGRDVSIIQAFYL